MLGNSCQQVRGLAQCQLEIPVLTWRGSQSAPFLNLPDCWTVVQIPVQVLPLPGHHLRQT